MTRNKKFLESLKEYVWIFYNRFEQLFNFANSIIFVKSKKCSKLPEKICMYSLTNFKNFLFLVIFAISLLLSRKKVSISSKVPQYIRLIELRRLLRKIGYREATPGENRLRLQQACSSFRNLQQACSRPASDHTPPRGLQHTRILNICI